MGKDTRMNFEAFYAEIDKKRNEPFEWGTNDCLLLACDLIDALYDTKSASKLRGQYKTPLQALKWLRSALGKDLKQFAISAFRLFDLNAKEIDPKQAKRGDLMLLFNSPDKLTTFSFGVCDGRFSIHPKKGGGIEFVHLSNIKKAVTLSTI